MIPIYSNPDEYDPTFTPTTLSDEHYYNLLNQGWGIPRAVEDAAFAMGDPVVQYFADLGKYPSNSEVVWTGLQFQPVDPTNDPFERLYTNLFRESFNSNLPASKGYFVIDLLDRSDSRQDAFSANLSKYPELTAKLAITLPTDSSAGGASVVHSFAGRVWYAGFSGVTTGGDARSPSLNNMVCFSQLIKNKQDTVKCYQEGDPTSRDSSDIVDTDGGFIKLSGANKILAMKDIGSSLIVFADNGVWAITGGSDYGFSAANYKTQKVTDRGLAARYSVVLENDKLYYWGNDGIYVLSFNQFKDIVAQNISEKTIQSLYNEIPEGQKEVAQGVYEGANKTIRWFFDGGDGETAKELVLHLRFGAFTINKLYNFTGVASLDGRRVAGIFVPTAKSEQKYLIRVSATSPRLSVGEFSRDDFSDWGEFDADAFILTGAVTANNTAIPKQTPYLTTHFTKTEDGIDVDGVPLHQSGCLIRSQWNWAVSALSNKFSPFFQAYRYRLPLFSEDGFDNGFGIVTTKNKLRGRGKALSLYFSTEEGKDCQLVGWHLNLNANEVT